MTTSAEKLQEFFPLFDLATAPARFNVAPTQTILAVRQLQQEARPQGAFLRWGLIPSWADDKSIGYKLINARAESIASKPSFRSAFRQRRCLVLADGFYEWKKEGKHKVPYHIRLKDGRPFAFAGLWERWEKEDPPIESCTIITTEANDLVQSLHDRMPVILDPRDYQVWLDPRPKDPAQLVELLQSFPAEKMTANPVSQRVNNVRNDDPQLLQEEKSLFGP